MEYELAELFDLQMGKTPARNEPKYWENGNNRWMSIADLSAIDKFIDNTKECISDLALQDTKIYKIPENTVVMSFKLSIGKVAITRCPMYSNEAIVSFLPKKGVNVLANYLYYVLKAKRWDDAGNKAVKGVTLNKSSLSRAKIQLHAPDEQRHICNVLDKLSSAVKLSRTQLAKMDELVKARFVEMFGDLVINTKGYTVRALSEIAQYWNGLTYAPNDVANDGVIVLRSSNIQNSALDFSNTIRVSCKIGEKKYVNENDILMCSRNGSAKLVGKVALIPSIKEPMAFGAFMMIIRSPQYYPYLQVFFQTHAFRRQIATGATTTINQITGNMLDLVKLPIPPVYEVGAFASFVREVDKSKVVVQLSQKRIDVLHLLW